MRRGPGIGGMQRKMAAQKRYENLGNKIEAGSISAMQSQLDTFQVKLEEFATKHKEKINKNPLFRAQFQKMCSSIGVDPLASNKGIWAQSLNIGDFYYELAVQMIEVCLRTRAQNGGIVSLSDLVTMLRNKRTKKYNITSRNGTVATPKEGETETAGALSDISGDDVKMALEKVAVLGGGYRVLPLGGVEMVISVPLELQLDHIELLQLTRQSQQNTPANGSFSLTSATQVLGWSRERVARAVDTLVREGLCWIDKKETNEVSYWVPSVWQDLRHNVSLRD